MVRTLPMEWAVHPPAVAGPGWIRGRNIVPPAERWTVTRGGEKVGEGWDELAARAVAWGLAEGVR
jgi:hypothetical protein